MVDTYVPAGGTALQQASSAAELIAEDVVFLVLISGEDENKCQWGTEKGRRPHDIRTAWNDDKRFEVRRIVTEYFSS